MGRKLETELQRSFAKRGGRLRIPAEISLQDVPALLEDLLHCPDCRAAVLEACNSDNRKDVDIDAVIRNLALSRHH